MAELVANCPRCDAVQMTFDVTASIFRSMEYRWKTWFEVFSVCRNCRRSTTFLIGLKEIDFKDNPDAGSPERVKGSLNRYFNVDRFISLSDRATIQAPQHTPGDIAAVFDEAAKCKSIQCWNATGAMLRLAIDLATKALIPSEPAEGLNSNVRGKLAFRLTWLFDTGRLPSELRDLSSCIREDGNDGAHDGTLGKEDADDLLDFTEALFERIFTEPEKLRLAKERREKRREQ